MRRSGLWEVVTLAGGCDLLAGAAVQLPVCPGTRATRLFAVAFIQFQGQCPVALFSNDSDSRPQS